MSSGDQKNASGLHRRRVEENGIEFEILEAGSGPLALCLHGFPDSAHTWRYLLPELAKLGFRAVAPFMRGYAPTGLAPDDSYYSARSWATSLLYMRRLAVMSGRF